MQDALGAILKVSIEKINLGIAQQRKYHVRYSTGKEIVYDSPPVTVSKFIKDNNKDMTKVSFMFKDRSDKE